MLNRGFTIERKRPLPAFRPQIVKAHARETPLRRQICLGHATEVEIEVNSINSPFHQNNRKEDQGLNASIKIDERKTGKQGFAAHARESPATKDFGKTANFKFF